MTMISIERTNVNPNKDVEFTYVNISSPDFISIAKDSIILCYGHRTIEVTTDYTRESFGNLIVLNTTQYDLDRLQNYILMAGNPDIDGQDISI